MPGTKVRKMACEEAPSQEYILDQFPMQQFKVYAVCECVCVCVCVCARARSRVPSGI